VASSEDALSSIAGLLVHRLNVPPARPELPASDAPCTRRAAHLAGHLKAHVPASASVPAWVLGLALASVPAQAELPASFRLRVRHRVRSAPARERAVAARHTRRPRKAR
jgi:hypothetical protein